MYYESCFFSGKFLFFLELLALHPFFKICLVSYVPIAIFLKAFTNLSGFSYYSTSHCLLVLPLFVEELEWGELTSELSFSLLWYRLLCIVTILKLLPSSKIGIPCTTTLPTHPFLYWLPFCLLFGLFSPSFGWNMLSGCFLRKVAQELNFRDLFLFKEKKNLFYSHTWLVVWLERNFHQPFEDISLVFELFSIAFEESDAVQILAFCLLIFFGSIRLLGCSRS